MYALRTYFLMRVTLNSLATDNLNLEMLVFEEGEKPWNPEKNPLSKDENQQQTQTNPHMMLGPGFEPEPCWWEASSLATAPSLLPVYR